MREALAILVVILLALFFSCVTEVAIATLDTYLESKP